MYKEFVDLIRPCLGEYSDTATVWLSLLIIALMAWLAYIIWSRLVVPVVTRLTARTATSWDEAMLNPRVLRAMGQLLPALLVYHYLPQVFSDHGGSVVEWVSKLTNIYIVWAIWFLVNRLIKSLYIKMVAEGHINEHSSKGLLQMAIIITACASAIIMFSILLGRSPVAIITALGATSAVLMLVFKDTIMGLVAGLQLSANHMLKKGDWIIVDRAGANGEVMDVSLTTVKVLNWDDSVTTVPPYVLVSESFQNYANMRQEGARRVKRSVNLDITTIRHLTDEEMQQLHRDGYITTEELKGGRAVNSTLLRHHLERMLMAHPMVRTDKTLMVRQLQSTATGMPLELFFFLSETRWAEFESIQSDIFDQVYALINRFNLSLYQLPHSTR